MEDNNDIFIYNAETIEDAALRIYEVYYDEYNEYTRPPVKEYLKKWVIFKNNKKNPLFLTMACLLFRMMLVCN